MKRAWPCVVAATGMALLAIAPLAPLTGCVGSRGGVKQFAPPDSSVMPRRVLVVKRGETDFDMDSFIDGVLVEVYLFNNDRGGDAADQPFHRAGTLSFKVFGPGSELLCEGEFDPLTMTQSESTGFFGSGYGLRINFAARGYEDVRERTAARMDFEFTPQAAPDERAFGSTQVRLGPVF
ncbi:MAG: hypothetical protein RIB58_12675 [Phycisphaerales bacterium]